MGKQSEIKKNVGEYLLILYTLSPLTSPGTCPSRWSSGGGVCCADLQVLALGRAPLPLPGEALNEGSLPHEAQGETTPVAVARSKNWYSAPTVTPEQSICRAWRLQGEAADLLSSWQERHCCPGPSGPLPVLGPPGLCLSWGRPNPGLCHGALCSGACAVGFSLPAMQPPLHGAAALAPLSCCRSCAAPSHGASSSALGAAT